MAKTYVGIIQNERYDVKILVLAENMPSARAKVLDKFGEGLGKTYQEADLQVIAFASSL